MCKVLQKNWQPRCELGAYEAGRIMGDSRIIDLTYSAQNLESVSVITGKYRWKAELCYMGAVTNGM